MTTSQVPRRAAAPPALTVPIASVELAEDDPIFVAIEKYKAACKTFDAATKKGGISGAIINATQAALTELVCLKPTTKEGWTAKRKYFKSHCADDKQFNTLPYAEMALEWVAKRNSG